MRPECYWLEACGDMWPRATFPCKKYHHTESPMDGNKQNWDIAPLFMIIELMNHHSVMSKTNNVN